MKKFTVMVFDESQMGKMKSVKLKVSSMKLVALIVGLFIVASITSFVYLFQLYQEREQMLSYLKDNNRLKIQMAGYAKQLDEIKKRVVELDELEYKVRDLATLQKGNYRPKQVAIGGKEVDLLRDYSAIAERREKEFFNDLNETLVSLSLELEKREISLSDLVDLLEEQKLIVRSTPTIWPVKGWVSSEFGYRLSPFSGRRVFHEGLDIAARYGTDIRSTAKGIVIYSGAKAGYGYLVSVDHGYGYISRYGHCSRLLVNVGDRIEKGQIIAKVGTSGRSTGPHVHYEVLVNGIPVNPLKFIVDESDI